MNFTRTFAAAALALAVSNAQAMTVFTDDFEADPSGGTFMTYNSDGSASGNMLTNWTVVQGSVDVIENGLAGLNCGGDRCLDLDGSTGLLGDLILETKLNFMAMAGDTVELSFDITDLNREDFDPFQVSFGSIVLTINAAPVQPVTFSIMSVAAADIDAPIRLEVLETPNSFGPIFDNIELSITTPTTTASEPAYMLLGGLAGLAVVRLARRRG
jgi:hypothetical protein